MPRQKKVSDETTAANLTPMQVVATFKDLSLKVYLLQEDKHLMLESIKDLTHEISTLKSRLEALEGNSVDTK